MNKESYKTLVVFSIFIGTLIFQNNLNAQGNINAAWSEAPNHGDYPHCFQQLISNETDEIRAVDFYLNSTCVDLSRFDGFYNPLEIKNESPSVYQNFLKVYIKKFKRANSLENTYIDLAFRDPNFLFIINAFSSSFVNVHNYYYYQSLAGNLVGTEYEGQAAETAAIVSDIYNRFGDKQKEMLSPKFVSKVIGSSQPIEDIFLEFHPYFDIALSLAEEWYAIEF